MTKKDNNFELIDKVKQNLLLKLYTNKDFDKKVKKIKKNYLKSQLLVKDKRKNLLKHTGMIEKLIEEYNLSEAYFPPLMQIIILEDEKITDPKLYFKDDRYNIIKNESGNETIFIPIYPETTIQDVKKILPEIKNQYKKILKKHVSKKIKKISKRNLEIIKLKNQGLDNNKIKKIIDIMYHEGLVENTVQKYEIPIIVNQLKKSNITKKIT